MRPREGLGARVTRAVQPRRARDASINPLRGFSLPRLQLQQRETRRSLHQSGVQRGSPRKWKLPDLNNEGGGELALGEPLPRLRAIFERLAPPAAAGSLALALRAFCGISR